MHADTLTLAGIRTRYMGPTNYYGSRIVADVPERIADRDRDRRPGDEGYELHTVAHWRLTIGYPHELNASGAHELAARQLAERLGWAKPGDKAYGAAMPDGYVWLFLSVDERRQRAAAILTADQIDELLAPYEAAEAERVDREKAAAIRERLTGSAS